MEYLDVKTPGLRLRVTPSDRRTFCLYRKVRGQPIRLTIGTFPEMTVEQARRAVSEAVREIRDGKDPRAQKRKDRDGATLQDLAVHWLAHAKQYKKTWADDQRIFDKYLGKVHRRKLSTITRADIQAWHTRIGNEHGPYMANRVRALLSVMFNRASEIGHDGPNPCVGVRRFKETSRARFIRPDEMRTFFEAIAAEPPLWRDYFAVLLFSGARRGNVAAMRWDELDLASGLWHLPASKMKNAEPTVVVLSPPAAEILRRRREADTSGTEWVFPSSTTGRGIVDPRKAWERVRRRSGLADLRMHDLRRSLGSWMATAGISLNVIGATLGHRDLKATQVYARLQTDTIRQGVTDTTAAMIQAGGEVLFLEVEGDDQDEN
jgi:integrase